MNHAREESQQTIDLSIVVPLFNEEESVAALVESIDLALQDFREPDAESEAAGDDPDRNSPTLKMRRPRRCEVILVDDGSLDQTVDVALTAAANASIPIQVISLQRNFGQTAAMQAGIDAARGELIATLDGDLQNDPADIVAMVRHLEQEDLDLLVGRRKNRQDGLVLRLIPSWIANRLIAKVTGVRIRDYGCSLKIYRASVIKRVRLMGEMHRFIPAWVASVTHPSRIGEIEVNHRARQFGVSKYGISRTVRVLIDLLSVLFFLKFRARPGHFFGTVGLLVGTVGAAMLERGACCQVRFRARRRHAPDVAAGCLCHALLPAVSLLWRDGRNAVTNQQRIDRALDLRDSASSFRWTRSADTRGRGQVAASGRLTILLRTTVWAMLFRPFRTVFAFVQKPIC